MLKSILHLLSVFVIRGFCRKLRKIFQKITSFPEHTWCHKKAVLLRSDGTLENYVLKSFFGFLSGILLTYLFFIFFAFQLNFSITFTTLICSVIGSILSLGLAFSSRVRCMVFLFLPQFFSKRGRQALMAYAFILVLTGPAKNATHNLAVLAESLECTQEHLKEAVKGVLDLMKQPFYALRDSLTKIMKSIKVVIRRIKRTLMAMKRLVLGILKVIKSVSEWLGSIVKLCNKKLGTPYDRCQKVFDNAVADCRAKLGRAINGVCNLTYVVGSVCKALKPMDLMCVLVSYVSDTIVDVVQEKILKFKQEMKAMFYVKIKFSHSFDMKTNKSRNFGEISSSITKDINRRSNRIFGFFDFVGFITTFFFIILLLRVYYYRYKWLSSDRFDNRYLSRYMREIDLKRAHLDKETIFPLNHRERRKYASLSSVMLIRSEKIKLGKTAVFLAMTSIKFAVYMGIDYCLFWILNTIRYHGRMVGKIKRPSLTESVEVEGEGYLADIYRGIVKSVWPDSREEEIESIPCLPDPKPPNYDSYLRIATLAFFCWIMALFEPYGLRLRHLVLNSYYPDRAKQRAVWLYNHILRKIHVPLGKGQIYIVYTYST